MKLASVLISGSPRFGVVSDRGFVDLTSSFQGKCKDLRDLLAVELIKEAALIAKTAPAHTLGAIEFQPVIPNLDARMFALGWSYKDHQAETGKDAPENPFIFSKLPQSLVGHSKRIVKPKASFRYDFEGEIVLVIGKGGRHIDPSRALEHVAGYSIAMDGSIRDWQQHSVTAGKNFDRSSSFGPWLVTRDEITNPEKLKLATRLNGETMQSTSFDLMAWDIGELVAYVSTFTHLNPGDSISTGTPGGVGNKRNPPIYMKPGDILEVEVSQIGTLRNVVVDEV